MSKCKCDLRTKLVGDGCRYCNPQEYIDHLIEFLEEQRTWVGLTFDERLKLAEDVDWAAGAYCEYAEKIEAKLKEKNT